MTRLRILSPCEKSWDAMQGGEHVRHCEACDKEVHDLTRLSEREASGYVRLRAGASMCARILVVGAAVAACGSPQSPSPAAPPVVGRRDVMEAGVAAAPTADPNADTDKDGVVDRVDACPNQPGAASDDANHNGCPNVGIVVTTMGDLQILPQIHFAKAKVVVLPEGAAIIDDVVAALKASPQITKVEVAGHASLDEHGAQALSEKRAAAVVAKIVAEGIDPNRLVAKGYAATLPIEDNKTDDGRAKNRRVEFKILESGESACALDAGAP